MGARWKRFKEWLHAWWEGYYLDSERAADAIEEDEIPVEGSKQTPQQLLSEHTKRLQTSRTEAKSMRGTIRKLLSRERSDHVEMADRFIAASIKRLRELKSDIIEQKIDPYSLQSRLEGKPSAKSTATLDKVTRSLYVIELEVIVEAIRGYLDDLVNDADDVRGEEGEKVLEKHKIRRWLKSLEAEFPDIPLLSEELESTKGLTGLLPEEHAQQARTEARSQTATLGNRTSGIRGGTVKV